MSLAIKATKDAASIENNRVKGVKSSKRWRPKISEVSRQPRSTESEPPPSPPPPSSPLVSLKTNLEQICDEFVLDDAMPLQLGIQWRKWWALVRHMADGGVPVYGAIVLISSLLKRRFIWKCNNNAATLAAFVALFRGVERYSKLELGLPESLRTPLAAFFASCCSFTIYKKNGRTSLLSYTFVQAITTLWDSYKKRHNLKSISNLEMWLLSIASSRVVYSWIFKPNSLEASHIRTLDYNSALPKDLLVHMRTQFNDENIPNFCDVLHPNQSCLHFSFLDRYPKLLRRSCEVYTPLHLFSTLVLQFQKWFSKARRPSVSSVVFGLFRSCLFLSSFYQIPVLVACFSPLRHHKRLAVAISGGVGAIALLIETKSKRKSIVAVVWMYALISFCHDLAQKINFPKRGEQRGRIVFDTLVFAMSTAIISGRLDLQNKKIIRLLYGYDIYAELGNKAKGVKKSD